MKKILFLHGFFASGQCVQALALKEALDGRAEIFAPDLPMHPRDALACIRTLCGQWHPDLLIGNSCGAFLAQMAVPLVGVPALLGNPHFQMTEFLTSRIGRHEYKSPRRDGKQTFVVDEGLIREFAEVQKVQFAHICPYWKDKVWGLFGEQDTLAHYEPLFLEHYSNAYHFPGGHTPTAEETRRWYAPLAEEMIRAIPCHVVQTERLIIRQLAVSDYESLAAILQDAETMYAYEGAFSDEETRIWLERQLERYKEWGYGLWAVISKEKNCLIGQCGLTNQEWNGSQVLEIGYLFNKDYWHLGYATEAAEACKRYAFDVLKAKEVCSIIRDTNVPSQRVALRNGMVRNAGVMVKRYRGVQMPHYLYSVCNPDCRKSIVECPID